MRESVSRSRGPQVDLFHPPPQLPAWVKLPREIRQQVVTLLAQMLREHHRRILTGLGKEAGSE